MYQQLTAFNVNIHCQSSKSSFFLFFFCRGMWDLQIWWILLQKKTICALISYLKIFKKCACLCETYCTLKNNSTHPWVRLIFKKSCWLFETTGSQKNIKIPSGWLPPLFFFYTTLIPHKYLQMNHKWNMTRLFTVIIWVVLSVMALSLFLLVTVRSY